MADRETARDPGRGSIRLLLVDDHAALREPLAQFLDRQPGLTVAGQAGSLAEARGLLAAGVGIDLAVVDLDLPDGHGAELLRDLRRRSPEAPALVLTASPDRREHARALAAGAAHVLVKTVTAGQLVEAIRRLVAGETLLTLAELVELLRLGAKLDAEDQTARRAFDRLSPREREVLRALAEGLDDKAIAARLGVGAKTAGNTKMALFRKLGVHSRLQAVLLAARHGVVRPWSPASTPGAGDQDIYP